jgi:hypothetical protein
VRRANDDNVDFLKTSTVLWPLVERLVVSY